MTSKIHKNKTRNAKTTNQKKLKIQTQLTINNSVSHTCNICGMTYYKYIKEDKESHSKYHNVFINGVMWSYKNESIDESVLKKNHARLKIITIDKQVAGQIKKVQEVLDMVNMELNAPLGSNEWQDKTTNSKAFLAIIDSKIIGLVTTETVESGKWMILRTQTVVPDQIKKLKLGISRIWVAPNWRRYGIGMKILDVVLKNSFHGIVLNKQDIGFSQPSTNGGLLFRKFNGVKHKTGEILLPIYLEN